MNNRKSLAEAQEIHRKGRFKGAERRYRKLLEQAPGNPEISFYLGLALLQMRRAREAVRHFEIVAKAAPNDAIVQDHLGQALLAAGEHKKALDRHGRAKALAPNRPEIAFNLGVALEQSGRLADAEAEYRAAIALAPAFFPAVANLGSILLTRGQYREAEPLLRKACQLNPKSQESAANMAYLLFRVGRAADADAALDALLMVAPAHPVRLLLEGRQKKRDGESEAAVELFRRATTAALPPRFVAEAWFELGQLLDKAKEFDRAFQAFEAMNGVFLSLAENADIDRQAVPRTIDAYRKWWVQPSEPLQAPQPGDGAPALPPVFFVGFPRSGTTLMEQIMGAHPTVATTNEDSPLDPTLEHAARLTGKPSPQCLETLTDQQRLELQRHFLGIARRVTASDLTGKLLVDKLPLNILKTGAVPWIFPDARVITAIRDPRDVCLSCYMQRFALNEGMIHFLNLESTVEFYAQVMGFWLESRSKLGVPWIEYRYEDLVADFEATAGRVLDFMGLSWDENVTRYADAAREREILTPSYEAVTREINDRAVSRWRNYAENFAPFQDTLAPFVRAFGYEPS